jgi:hypothetical protein
MVETIGIVTFASLNSGNIITHGIIFATLIPSRSLSEKYDVNIF